jgi:hypothetical protein
MPKHLATLETLYSTANGLRIRTAPTTKPGGKVIGKLHRGDVVKAVFNGIRKGMDEQGEMDIPTPWQKSNSNVQWVYISAPKKGWVALRVGSKIYLQDTPPKAGTPAMTLPDIKPEPIQPPSGAGVPVIVAIIAGGLGAWWWFNRRKKK